MGSRTRNVIRIGRGDRIRLGRQNTVRPSATRVEPTLARPNKWASDREQRLRAELDRVVAKEDLSNRVLVAVIVPVLRRPERVKPLLESFRAATTSADARLYFVAQRSDTAEVRAIEAVGLSPIFVGDGDRSWAKKINRGYAKTREPWLLLGADDLAFRPGWIDKVRSLLHSHPGVIGTNDMGNRATVVGTHSTHPLVRRAYADVCGTVDARRKICHEGYDHNFPDTELVATAKRRRVYVHRSDCVIEHLHPLWGKGKADHVYELGQKNFTRDKMLFEQRAHQYGLR